MSQELSHTIVSASLTTLSHLSPLHFVLFISLLPLLPFFLPPLSLFFDFFLTSFSSHLFSIDSYFYFQYFLFPFSVQSHTLSFFHLFFLFFLLFTSLPLSQAVDGPTLRCSDSFHFFSLFLSRSQSLYLFCPHTWKWKCDGERKRKIKEKLSKDMKNTMGKERK